VAAVKTAMSQPFNCVVLTRQGSAKLPATLARTGLGLRLPEQLACA
jgi:hypothetical protein